MDYTISGMEMRSGKGEQYAVTIWDYTIAKDGNYWFWPAAHDEPGSMVHCGFPVHVGKPRSAGYGGSLLKFPTINGVIEIQGPWHSNTEALFEQTGIDLRDKHRIFGVIAKERISLDNKIIYKDVLYIDPEEGIVGFYNRVSDLAQTYADSLDIPVYAYSQSHGGSSSGPVEPKTWSRERTRKYWQEKQREQSAKT